MTTTRSGLKRFAPSAGDEKPKEAVPTTICPYCLTRRTIGKREICCTGCRGWFHLECLFDVKWREFWNLPYPLCYKFLCRNCGSTGRDSWEPTPVYSAHICVIVMANLTHIRLNHRAAVKDHIEGTVFIKIDDVIEFTEENWSLFSEEPKPSAEELKKDILRTLSLGLFKTDNNGNYALNIKLSDVGPMHSGIQALPQLAVTPPPSPPPQPVSRKAQKKTVKAIDKAKSVRSSKRNSPAARAALLEELGIPPSTTENWLFYGTERDPHATASEYNNREYRILTLPTVTLSPNDKADGLMLSADRLTVRGFDGHRMIRATHSVLKGTWYYEVEILSLPPGASIRIGWSRQEAPLGAALGFTKYTYAWRSEKGTKFHDGKGKKYQPTGYKEGDVVGVLIHLPEGIVNSQNPSKYYLPPSRKNCHLVGNEFKCFRRVFTYNKPPPNDFLPFPGTKIEFFLNGKPCGVAFEDIYWGLYHPAVSLYSGKYPPSVRFHFGPELRHLPEGARPMSERAEEWPTEQTLSDMLFLLDHNEHDLRTDY